MSLIRAKLVERLQHPAPVRHSPAVRAAIRRITTNPVPTAAIAILILINTVFAGAQAVHFNDDLPADKLAGLLVESMSDREALGQVLMFGYPEEEPDTRILDWIEQDGLGSVKIFGWNAGDLENLAQTVTIYQDLARSSRFGIPLLIATDQEGGWVRHIKGDSSITPGNMALGAGRLPYDAWMTGRLLGKELAAVGVNMNFAPTIDVFVNPRADVIGPRAFMADPVQTGILGLAFLKGHEEAGVIATAKHFPGHGDTADDSHGTLPVVFANLEKLRNRDLIPYRMMIAGGLPAIMVGHLAYPSITGNNLPATLSPTFLTDLLRTELDFKGVAITDDLFMRGARTDGASMPEICARSMLAGADLLLVSQTAADHRTIHEYLLKEMAGPLFNQRVREAAGRVVELKARYLKKTGGVSFNPNTNDIPAAVPALGAGDFFLNQASRSITVVNRKRFPLPGNEAGRVLIAGAYGDFLSEGKLRYPQADLWRLNYRETKSQLRRDGKRLAEAAKNYDTVIVLLPDEEMAILIDELEELGEKIVVISILSPAHLDQVPWVSTSLAAYGSGKDSFTAVFAALIGDFPTEGRLPIHLESLR